MKRELFTVRDFNSMYPPSLRKQITPVMMSRRKKLT